MPAMHWCTCRVNLSGQNLHIVVIGPHHPVSWPEIQVLSMLHGEDNLYDIKPCAIADVNPSDEKRRLWAKYGPKVENVFPGRVFRMELVMPGEGLDHKRADGEGYVVADMGSAPDPEYGAPVQPPTTAVFKPEQPGRMRPAQATLPPSPISLSELPR